MIETGSTQYIIITVRDQRETIDTLLLITPQIAVLYLLNPALLIFRRALIMSFIKYTFNLLLSKQGLV